MGADECAGVALDTLVRIPAGYHDSDATFLVGCCACGHRTVGIRQEGADGEGISILGVHYVGDLLDESRSETVLIGGLELGSDLCPLGRDVDFGILTATVDSSIVHVDDVLALLAIALDDSVLHVFDSILVRNDAGNLEECGLQDGVGPVAEADLRSDLGSVDNEQPDVLLADDGLHVVRNPLDCLSLVPEGVEKEGTILLDALENIVLLEV